MSKDPKFTDTIKNMSKKTEKVEMTEYKDPVSVTETIRTYNVQNNGDIYIPTTLNRAVGDKLPAGYYDISANQELGLYFSNRKVKTDELINLPNPLFNEIINDMQDFWNREERYREYGMVHKRGILLYGPPGTGKSALLSLLSKTLIDDHDGIVLNYSGLDLTKEGITKLRKVEPKRKVYVQIEDIDGFFRDLSHRDISTFLNLLDGVYQTEHIVWLATTNHPEHLAESLTSRPSRFDRKYLIGPPTWEERIFFLENKVLPRDYETILQSEDMWREETDGMTLADLKEVIISVFIMGMNLPDVRRVLKDKEAFSVKKEIKGLVREKQSKYFNDSQNGSAKAYG